MKKKMACIVLALLCLGMTACGQAQTGGKNTSTTETISTQVYRYENIKPAEAKKRLESEKGIVLLDVRTPEEYAEKHIPGSLLIPVDVIEKEAPSKLTDKNAVIFVYCRSGNRSVTASKALLKMGYTQVYNLGGIIDWPYETKSGQ